MRIYLTVALSILSVNLCSQNKHPENYTMTVSFLDENQLDSIIILQYFDGLGRPSQSVVGGVSVQGKFLHYCLEYDLCGREKNIWLPVAGSTEPDFMPLSETNNSLVYQDSRPFYSKTYDALDRPLVETMPGKDWKDKGKKINYRGNVENEVIDYDYFDLSGSSFYPKSQLSCISTIDENDLSETMIFVDNQMKTILERKGCEGNYFDTYFVYDVFGRLSYVLQPNYQKDPDLSKFAFQYNYNNKGLVSSKKLPGCEPIEYWYDNANRIICMQDGALRKARKYRFYLYDQLGRLCVQGLTPKCYEQKQLSYIGYKKDGPQILTSGYAYSGDATELQLDKVELEIVNYYDNYDFLKLYPNLNLASPEGPILDCYGEYSENSKYCYSLLTGTWQKASNGEPMLSSIVYDDYGRIAKQAEIGLGKKGTVTEFTYNFVGDITNSVTTHLSYNTSSKLYQKTLVQHLANNYDAPHTKLLTSSVITIDDYVSKNSFKDTIQALTYDDFGNIVKIDRGGKKADMSYQYDLLHGWVKQIKSNGGFEQNLYRETDGKHPRWDGSISAMSWKTDNEYIRRYDYTYDELNRLTSAEFGSKFNSLSINNKVVVPKDSLVRTPIIDKPIIGIGLNSASAVKSLIPETGSSLIAINALDAGTVQYNAPVSQSVSSTIGSRIGGNMNFYVASDENYSESVSYDSNSNIISLQRYGDFTSKKDYGLIDDLTITHNGNQLRSVEDQAGGLKYNDALDFDDGKDSDDEYSYNGNGALTMDLNKGIQNIEYDLLGDPVKVTLDRDRIIEYVYAADGRRLRVKHSQVIASLTPAVYGRIRCMTKKVVSDSTDYIGNLILKNGTPSMYQFNGGYYSFNEAGALDGCHYYVEDYQGNNRMVVNANTDEIEQVTHYYPFGGVMADISIGQDLQKFKYGNKELDRTYGLDLYDFHARQYDAIMSSFTSIDPMAEKYYSISPYAYCAGDPVNLIDPTGMNPVYDVWGNFLGNTREGFTGEIIVYQGDEEFNSSDMTAEEFINDNLETAHYDFGNISDKAKEKIWNNIISHFDGKRIFERLEDRTVFSVKDHGNVFFSKEITGDKTNWRTFSQTGEIYGADNYQYETSVENIACSVIAHEWYGHYKRKWGDGSKNHRFAYQAAMNSVWYPKTTEFYKESCQNKYKDFLSIESKNGK